MEFQTNVLLAQYTTFRLGGPARLFCRAQSAQDLHEAISRAKVEGLPLLILGGGSNIVASDDGFDGVVVKLENIGVSASEVGDEVLLVCPAGESWDGVVSLAVQRGWWGIENLSHIPGNVGAFAVQNVGAYGQEASQVVDRVTALDSLDGQIKELPASVCRFGYRQSIFNGELKGRYVILAVTLRLNKVGKPNLSYPDLARYFAEEKVADPTLVQIREAIISIRDRKFTTPDKIPNAGSFFKNLIISEAQYAVLEQHVKENFPPEILVKLQDYRARLAGPAGLKIPTAFLVEACGLKGAQIGGAKINETQPLVMLNIGTASARDVLALMRQVRRTVFAKTGMALAPEPELVGFTERELKDYFSLE